MIHINAAYFLFGFLLAIIGVELLSGLSELISTIFELARAALSLKIARYGAEIQRINKLVEKEEQPDRAIGFAVPASIDYENDGEEYDDKKVL